MKNKDFITAFLLLISVFITSNCNNIESSTPSAPSVPSTSKVGYCQALLEPEQAQKILQVVVDAFNQSMAHLPNFVPAQINSEGIRPSVSFSDTAQPRLYYAGSAVLKLHSTLCKSTGDWYKCADKNLARLVQAKARSDEDIIAFAKYYEPMVAKEFSLKAPRNFGPRFIALPLVPERLYDSVGQEISDVLHVSLVRIDQDNLDDEEAQDLHDRFKNALNSDFNNFIKHNSLIRLGKVVCTP